MISRTWRQRRSDLRVGRISARTWRQRRSDLRSRSHDFAHLASTSVGSHRHRRRHVPLPCRGAPLSWVSGAVRARSPRYGWETLSYDLRLVRYGQDPAPFEAPSGSFEWGGAPFCIERFVGAGTRSPVRAGHRRNASERSPERRAETAECATPSSYGDFAAGAQGDGTNAASDFCSWWPRARGETWTESGRARVVAARKQATEDDGRTTPCSATTWSARRRTELTMTPSEERARRGWRVERGCRRNAGNG